MRLHFLTISLLLLAGASSALAVTQSDASQNSSISMQSPPPADRTVSQPVAVRVQTDMPLRVETSNKGGVSLLNALIVTLPALIALFASLLVVRRSNQQSEKNSVAAINLASANAKAAVNQKANELEIARIDDWLATFFGPFMQLSGENKKIADLLRSRQADPNFRTLKALLDPEWKKTASATDLNLINRIVANGIQLRQLIREKAGATGPELTQYLSHAAAHFSILELADAGALTDQTGDFHENVYPRQLDPVLQLERQRLEQRRHDLLGALSERHAVAPPLEIPLELALSQRATESGTGHNG